MNQTKKTTAPPAGYLVVRHEDGFGDVFPLVGVEAAIMGRALTSQIVLKDDLCSREHAEISRSEKGWRLRDLDSLNGTHINGKRLDGDWELEPGDEIELGRTRLLFVEELSQLPGIPAPVVGRGRLAIKKRLGETRFQTPVPAEPEEETIDRGTLSAKRESPSSDHGPRRHHGLSRDLSLLYHLALRMGTATSAEELGAIVLETLFDAIPAEGGGIFILPSTSLARNRSEGKSVGRDGGHAPPAARLQKLALKQNANQSGDYLAVTDGVFREVYESRQAVLAEDAARGHYVHKPGEKDDQPTSLICAPIIHSELFLGIIHLYRIDPHKILDEEDLHFTMAVARQLGGLLYRQERDESLTAVNQSLRDQLKIETEMVGQSQAICRIESQIQRVAPTSATCLVRGESGVGKELVARAIHFNSLRREGPFVCLNCAALTETLLESELFGHEKGAFTGATDKKIGKFEAAHLGTIFLDEIAEMTVSTQAKLLRILDGQPFERVGGGEPIRVDVRVVAATNKELEEAVHIGSFRRDLFFRLQVVEISIPPLRERKDDIDLLAGHFLARFAREMNRKIDGFTPEARKKMQAHDWPGNVRELRNVIERAVALGRDDMIHADDIWLTTVDLNRLAGSGGESRQLLASTGYEPRSLKDIEKTHIANTLQYTDWNKSQAAAILKIERSTLDRKIRDYDLRK